MRLNRLVISCFIEMVLVSVVFADEPARVDVTMMGKGNESCGFVFKGCPFPYAVSLWEGPSGGKIYRGLTLRHALNLCNAWYMSGFMEVALNGKNVLSVPNIHEKYPLLFEHYEVLETGKRALVQYIWERDEATVRLRFLVRPESRALMVETTIEPKTTITDFHVNALCFPGAYTTKGDGERRMKTATREEKSVGSYEVDPTKENWMLFCDEKLDMAYPINRRVGFSNNGCAGLYVFPDNMEKVNVRLEGYPIYICMTASNGATRLRYAFDELAFSNAAAFKIMQEEAPRVQKILQEETFQPAILAGFNVDDERKKLDEFKRQGISRDRVKILNQALNAVQGKLADLKWNSDKPITAEQSALDAIDFYRRQYLTASRLVDKKMRVFEMRGPAFIKYRLANTLKRAGKGFELNGGYFFLSSQGRGVTDLPSTIDDLYKYDVVVMLDIDTRGLATQSLQMLRQYVEVGGGLIVFGGYFSYSASNIRETPLAGILPFGIDENPFGLRQSPETATLAVTYKKAFLNHAPWINNLVSPWYHDLKVKKDGQVVISNGGVPWMAIKQAGKGRVIASAGNLLGKAGKDKVVFYKWNEWPDFFWAMIQWSSGKCDLSVWERCMKYLRR